MGDGNVADHYGGVAATVNCEPDCGCICVLARVLFYLLGGAYIVL